jgi:hypothetical protein
MTTTEFINKICPEHDRTTCDDDNLSNGFGSRDEDGFRCTRCALLEIAEGIKDCPPKFYLVGS